jgi:uncharacterized protein YdaU (DUF1376 family)
MKHYKHDFERFRKATTRLNSDEKMIYLNLMWYLYEEESLLPSDTDELEYIAYSNDILAIKKVLKLFFEETADGYGHEYVRRQLNQQQALRERMRGVAAKSWEAVPEEVEKFWKSLPSDKDYKHKGRKSQLISLFRRKKSNIVVDDLVSYCKRYFKFVEDANFWKSPKRLVDEYIFEPNFRYGSDKINNYTKGVK